MPFRPSKWIQYSPVAVLPFVAALMINSAGVHDDLMKRGTAALASAGADWAKLEVEGRDATVSGDAWSQKALDDAVKAVAGTYGIRRVVSASHIVPPPDLVAPTVTDVDSNSPTPTLKGTWPSAVANLLKVTLGSTVFELGKAPELKTDGDNWTLTPSSPIPDGTLDVGVEVADKYGRSAKSATPGHLLVDTKPPAAPVLGNIAVDNGQVKVTGNWPEGDAVSLVIGLAGKLWQFGKDAALTSDGKGTFTFAPDSKLDPGTYDLDVTVKDKVGNATTSTAKGAVVVPEQPPSMKAPTVTSLDFTSARPVITGTWSEIGSSALSVALGAANYVLGKDDALKSDGIGNWTLTVPEPLKDGSYPIRVTSTDTAGTTLTNAATDSITIDAVAPGTPSVVLYAGEESPSSISGHWDSANAKELKVAIPAAGVSAELGKDQALTAAGDVWTLALSKPLPPGSYDVAVTTIDSHGRVSSDQTKFEIFIKEAAAPPTPTPPSELKAPTVAPYTGEASPASISGTWDEGNATMLSVAIPSAHFSATLGGDSGLTSDGAGNWTYVLPGLLAPGTYEVTVTSTAKDGRSASDTSLNEIEVKAPPAPPPPAPPPPEFKAPTINAYAGADSPNAISGTWDDVNGQSLTVAIPGAKLSDTLGSSKNLTGDGKGNWNYAIPSALPPGIYDVEVTATAKDGRVAKDQSTAEIYVKGTVPPTPPRPPAPPALKPPTINAYAGDTSPASITGTWDEGNATMLTVGIPAVKLEATLGKDTAISTDGKGSWKLAILNPLPPGIYDVEVKTEANDGRVATDGSTAEIYIKQPPPPPPPPEPPYDCAGAMQALGNAAPVLFAFNSSVIEAPYGEALKQYAALLTDKRCLDTKALVTGHADYIGGSLYNVAISIERAQRVADRLAADGVDVGRLKVAGDGKNEPVDPARTSDARSKNRRVTISIAK